MAAKAERDISAEIRQSEQFRPDARDRDITDELFKANAYHKYLIRYCTNPEYVQAGVKDPKILTLQYLNPATKSSPVTKGAMMLFINKTNNKVCLAKTTNEKKQNIYAPCYDDIPSLIDAHPSLNGIIPYTVSQPGAANVPVSHPYSSFAGGRRKINKHKSRKHKSRKHKSRK